MLINVSKGKENYSQRNNEIAPLESCNATSYCMNLDYLGYTFPKGKYRQPEDNFQAFMLANKFEKTNHYDLVKAANLWMGKTVASFYTNCPIRDIWLELAAGRGVVMSGTFPGYPTLKKTPLGHIVCLVGAEWKTNDTTQNPISVIVDDPYGNTMDDWKGSGNDIVIPWDKFVAWFKPVNDPKVKWAHIFKPLNKI